LNIRWNKNEDVVVPEWQRSDYYYLKTPIPSCGSGSPAAYIKDQRITIKAVFSSSPEVTSANIGASSGFHGQLGNIVRKTVTFSEGTSGEVMFQMIGRTPEQILSFYQEWHWYCENINGTGSKEQNIGASLNQIYIVLSEPQLPWTASGQREPWVAVLRKSCAWACGETTREGAAENIAKYLYLNAGGLYDIYHGAAYYGFPNFNLTGFLNNMPDVGMVNCFDMGRALVTFANALGCNMSYRLSNPFGYLNCIFAIGRGWTNNPFYGNPDYNPNPIVDGDWGYSQGRSLFGIHAFSSISDNIFDACLTVDTDDDPDHGPPFEETWMIDEPWTGYKSKVVDNYPPVNTSYPNTPSFNIY
jgi:hypothetical protein